MRTALFASLIWLGSALASQAEPITTTNCAAAIDYASARRGLSVLVLQDGVRVCSTAETTLTQRNELWSGTKSFLGLIAAAAVQDGLLQLDEPVSATIGEWRSDPARSAITIRQLLSMTSGHASEVGRPPAYAAAIELPLSASPGERFQYGPAPSQIFGELMRRKLLAAGLDANARDYLRRRLLTPLGIATVDWRDGVDGLPLMPQGAALSAREWALVGEFVRVRGRVGDRALVDEHAFAEVFNGSQANPAYGLSWWLARATTASDVVTRSSDIPQHVDELPADLVFAAGAGDQRLFVIPSLGLTIVRQAQLDLASLSRRDPNAWSDAQFLALLLGTR